MAVHTREYVLSTGPAKVLCCFARAQRYSKHELVSAKLIVSNVILFFLAGACIVQSWGWHSSVALGYISPGTLPEIHALHSPGYRLLPALTQFVKILYLTDTKWYAK